VHEPIKEPSQYTATPLVIAIPEMSTSVPGVRFGVVIEKTPESWQPKLAVQLFTASVNPSTVSVGKFEPSVDPEPVP
jgi:hypothetical protein